MKHRLRLRRPPWGRNEDVQLLSAEQADKDAVQDCTQIFRDRYFKAAA